MPKSVLPTLPEDFELTDLGEPKEGAVRQYRGPHGVHVHEFAGYWEMHVDFGDPRTIEGLITHLTYDVPEIPAATVVGLISGYFSYRESGDLRKALTVGALFALGTYLIVRELKTLLEPS